MAVSKANLCFMAFSAVTNFLTGQILGFLQYRLKITDIEGIQATELKSRIGSPNQFGEPWQHLMGFIYLHTTHTQRVSIFVWKIGVKIQIIAAWNLLE